MVWTKKIFALTAIVFSLLTTCSCFASDAYMGSSRWGFGKTAIRGELDCRSILFAAIEPIQKAKIVVNSIQGDEFSRVAKNIIQPYIDKNLSLFVNGRKYPVRVTRLTRDENHIFTIYLSVDGIGAPKPVNHVKIVYSMLFRETQGAHHDYAVGYFTDAQDGALDQMFCRVPPPIIKSFQADAPVWEFESRINQRRDMNYACRWRA